MVRAAGGDPALHAGEKVRHGPPHDSRHRQIGHRQDGLHRLDVLDDEPEPPAHVDERNHNSGASLALEHQPGRVLLVHADAKVVGLNSRLVRRQGGADLQHVGAERIFLPLHQMIGVVLHKGGSTVSTLAHGLENGGHGGDLPVALAAVAVALGHEMLGGQTRQLLHAVEVLEGVGERFAALPVHHLFDGDFLLGLIANGGDIVRGDVVAGHVDLHQLVDLRLRDGVHLLDQIAHCPGVHLPAQFLLDLHLVSLGDGHLPHVVPEAHDLHLLGDSHAHGGAHPVGEALYNLFILPVPGDDLPGHPQTGGDEAVLPVPMGRLIQIHEVHVDLLVGDLHIVLGGQMAVGLLEGCQAVNPHLRRRECMAPGDDTRDFIQVVGLLDNLSDLGVGLGRHLVDQRIGQDFRQLRRNLCGPLRHDVQHLLPVQVLRAHYKPKFTLFHIHIPPKSILFPSRPADAAWLCSPPER